MKTNKIVTAFSIIIFFTVSGFIAADAQSKVYYVSPDGSSSNPGTSINKPFASVNRALKQAAAGDTVYLLPGTYKEIIVFRDKKGIPEKSICLTGITHNPKEYPVIDGGAEKPLLDGQNDWMYIKDSDWLSISRIKFVNGWTYPVKIRNSSYLSFDSCIFYGGKRVINVAGILSHHILVENCYWDQGGRYLWTVKKDSAGVEAWLSMHHVGMGYYNGSLIDFSGTGGSIVIRNNTIINAYNAIRFRGQEGCDADVEIYGNRISYVRDNDFEPEYYSYNLFIYNNISHNIHRTLSVDNVRGGYIYYFGNVVTDDNDPWTQQVCASFGKIYGSERQLDYPLYVFNNSFCGAAMAYKMDAGKAILLKHFNNAFYFRSDTGFIVNQWDKTLEFDYDIVNTKWPENIIKHNREQHGKVTDIKFADPGKEDLRLEKNSPGIDAGKVITLKELDWTQRYEGKGPDIGAYENGNLIEGPAFRFKLPPDSKITYNEKPRIVRYDINGNKITLYFSSEIDPSSVNKEDINLYNGQNKLVIENVAFPDNKYQMVLTAGPAPLKGGLSVSFNIMPKGTDGELATYWASAIKINGN